MAKSKDRTLNPAAAQLKLDKQKALKKGKAAVQAQRITRLAARNPKGLERQIADLQALPSPSPRDKKNLEDAERELARMRRAKEIVGDGPNERQNDRDRMARARRDGGGGGLGKRRWEGEEGRRGTNDRARVEGGADGEDSDTDASVRAIPMPRDTPPPIPHPARIRTHARPKDQHASSSRNQTPPNLTNANLEPLSSARGLDIRPLLSQAGTAEPAAPAPAAPPAKTVYEAKPIVRDLRKEAVNKFMPEAVRRRKMVDPAGAGSAADPVEVSLETQPPPSVTTATITITATKTTKTATKLPLSLLYGDDISDLEDEEKGRRGGEGEEERGDPGLEGGLDEEEERFRREIQYQVEIEDGDD